MNLQSVAMHIYLVFDCVARSQLKYCHGNWFVAFDAKVSMSFSVADRILIDDLYAIKGYGAKKLIQVSRQPSA